MKRYDKVFKDEAVRLSDEIGPKKAAEQLGVAYYHTLQDWRKRRTLHGDGAHAGSGRAYPSTEKCAREIELVREIGELRRANDILKDALGFFALELKMNLIVTCSQNPYFIHMSIKRKNPLCRH